MPSSSDVVVLAASAEELAGWIGTLQDWSALGLVRDFIAIDFNAVASGSWEGVVVERGRTRSVLVHDEIAARADVSSVGVWSLGRVGNEPVLPDRQLTERLRDWVRHTVSGMPFTWGQILAAGVTSSWPEIEESRLGWTGGHTVVLSPESSHSPATGKAPITAEDLSKPLGLTHAAAALASVVGLWIGAERGVVHGAPDSGRPLVVLARTYTRHVTDGESVRDLLERVIDVGSGYPVPVALSGRPMQRVSDEHAAARRMADCLITKHETVLARGERRAATVVRANVRVSVMAKNFFRFIWTALRLAPETFARALEAEAARVTAPHLQRFLLGSDSAFQITVNDVTGVASDGELVPPVALEAQLEARLGELIGEGSVTGESRHDQPELWKDFLAGGLTLLDGQERNDKLPVPVEAGAPGVVTDPAVVVTDLTDFELPSETRRVVSVSTLPANDFGRMAVVERMIEDHARREPDSAYDVGHLRRRLQEWREAASNSYSGRVGMHIAEKVEDLRTEVLEHHENLRRHQQSRGLGDDVLRTQRSLGRWTWMMILVALLATAALVATGSAEIMPWSDVAVWVPATWVGAVALLLVIYLRRQRALFHLLHRREAEVRAAEAAYLNLADALRDLKKFLALQRQFRDWSTVLAHFVKTPFGTMEGGAESSVRLGPGFGHNHRFGRVSIEPSAADDLARRVQSDVMKPGWLSEAWRTFLQDLPEFEDRHRVELDPDLIFTDARMGDRPVLTVWADSVVHHRRNGTAPVQSRLDAFIEELPRESARRVTWLDGSGSSHDDTYAQFVRGAEPTPSREDVGEFSHHVFAAVPETLDPWRVASTVAEDHTDRGGPIVLTQLTEPFPARDLAFCRADQIASAPEDFHRDAPQM